MDERDQRKDSTDQGTEDYMPPEAAAAYERKAKIIAVCIVAAVLFAGALVFDLGTSSWEPQPRETIFVPKGNKKTPPDVQHDVPQAYDDHPPSYSSPSPAPVFDRLLVAHPRNPYDLPVFDADTPHDGLRMTAGEVKKIDTRNDKMNDGSTRKNLYARTEFYQPESRGVCYFYQYMGLEPTYSVGERVRVQYDTRAKDVCGSSRIVKR